MRRRDFLAAGAATLAATRLGFGSAGAQTPKDLSIERRVIEVRKKPANVYGLAGPNGRHGLELAPGEKFRVTLHNRAGLPALIHWHGQTPPLAQDGVPGLSQPLLPDGQRYEYDYTPRPGTHWMHSHEGLQEQLLMAAPLIVRDAAPTMQEAVVILHDFTFTDPTEVFATLSAGHGAHGAHGAHGGMDHSTMDHSKMDHSKMDHAKMGHGSAAPAAAAPMVHLHDVEYDAYLANDRTLDDPEVIRVEPGAKVLLRLINAATATAFIIDTSALPASAVAVDGNPVEPVPGRRFPLAMGQRLDLILSIPRDQGAWPVFARREGELVRTGVVFATARGRVAKIASESRDKAPAAGLAFEQRLRAIEPLAQRASDRTLRLVLGEKPPYIWTLNDEVFEAHTPLSVRRNERVHLTFENTSSMMHPMHLHGHHFQVIELGRQRVAGAMRDTVIVPANGGRVTVAFDTDNVGEWMLHCHNLYHMAAGMMTTVKYEG